jgi:hypothetical protein
MKNLANIENKKACHRSTLYHISHLISLPGEARHGFPEDPNMPQE